MQSKTPLLMVTALVCGLGAAFGTWKLVTGAQNNPGDEVKVKVLVPVADVSPYYLFQDAQRFTELEWPKSKLREGEDDTIRSFDQLRGKTSRHYKLKMNEPIYKSDICEDIENDVNERLQNGEVAHAVQVSADRAGGGFVAVGDHIDIEATVQPNQGETSVRTFYFLEDVEVLAVDNQAQKAATTIATPPTRFLLRLTKPQSLVMKFFQDTSKIDFVKRKKGDKNKVGESIYFTFGKKTSSVPGYQDDLPEATVATNIEEKKLNNPTDDDIRPRAEKPIDGIKLKEDDETITKRMPHKALINDSGTQREQKTNETFNVTEKKKKDNSTNDAPNKDGTNKDEGKKNPG